MFSLKDKVILITGATGYLGSYMVKDLSKMGAKVIVLSTSLNKAYNLCKRLNIPTKQAFKLDITDDKEIKKVIYKIYKKFKKIDVLVNNASFSVTKYFNKYSRYDWYKSFDGNVISIDMITKEVVKYMKKNGGRIINISSMYGIVSPNAEVYPSKDMINPLSYGVGKAGLIQYTKYLAMMLAKYNINVNCVSYGPFPNINKVKDKKFLNNLANKTMLKRIGYPKEATSVIYFLSLDESSFITGQNFIVDGGWTSW